MEPLKPQEIEQDLVECCDECELMFTEYKGWVRKEN
jgi:hypothetical protein